MAEEITLGDLAKTLDSAKVRLNTIVDILISKGILDDKFSGLKITSTLTPETIYDDVNALTLSVKVIGDLLLLKRVYSRKEFDQMIRENARKFVNETF